MILRWGAIYGYIVPTLLEGASAQLNNSATIRGRAVATPADTDEKVRPRLITLDPDVDEALRREARRADRPMARIVNEALRAMLDLEMPADQSEDSNH